MFTRYFSLLSCLLYLLYSFNPSHATKTDEQSVSEVPTGDKAVRPQLKRRQFIAGAIGAGAGILGYKGYKAMKDRWRCGPQGAYCYGYDSDGDGIPDYNRFLQGPTGMNPYMMGGGMGGAYNPYMMGGGMGGAYNPYMMGGGMGGAYNPSMMGGGMGGAYANAYMMGGVNGYPGSGMMGFNPMMGYGGGAMQTAINPMMYGQQQPLMQTNVYT